MLETINLPEIETVNGSIIMEANMEASTGSFVPKRNDASLCFRWNGQTDNDKGTDKDKEFHGTQTTSRLEQDHHTGSITPDYLEDVSEHCCCRTPDLNFEKQRPRLKL